MILFHSFRRTHTQNKDEAYSWELLGHLSGIDPRELVGESAHRLANGLLGDADERSLFNMFAWYLEPEVRQARFATAMNARLTVPYTSARRESGAPLRSLYFPTAAEREGQH